MKKYISFALLLALSVPMVLTSCGEDESEGLSRITYYAILELNGEANMTTQIGEAFSDPSCKATMAGEDVSDQVVTTGTVNTSALGFYKLSYSVVNPDGFSASAVRTVAVVDRNNFASTYFGESQYGVRHYYNAPITISDLGDGSYLINDVLGGFYSYGRYPGYDAYGYDFFLEALLKLNADNSVEIAQLGSWYWGDDVPTLLSGSYDPATGTVVLNMDFGAPFTVVLTK